ncbi:uncharacterized protein LOC106450347 [Brassica napus]|uniref:uncharacterized protein LOC106450347 n=1 Tax=Brassica napus TaxID=3708 RepID=UPI0006AAFAA8|nr:uncharacterized protein LOC106450347 [Brassica napus]
MDPNRSIYNLAIHKHPLFPSARFFLGECAGCHVKEHIYGGYICNEPCCYGWFHKECAEAPPEINHHPSHLEHPLLLTNDSQPKDSPCDCCGKNLLSPCYTCPTCEFKVDLICGMKPSPPAIEHPMCHDHSLVFLKKREVEVPCDACKESIGGPSYSCLECIHVYFHLDCVHLSKEMYHPCHPSHPLEVAEESKKSCYFCAARPKVLYHCSICNFSVCFGCTKHPPPLVVEDPKTHKHPLSLFASQISFTCNRCGTESNDPKPYICVKCNFVVHGNCIDFPRIININRHDHRISFTYHPGRRGPRGTRCGFCWGAVSQYYGAYVCSVCPDYTVHSRCAVYLHVWNGVDLEGTPERSEDIAPFKVVGHNLIRHFSHSKHTLRLVEDIVNIHDVYESIRCGACVSPVGFGPPIYACGNWECHFFLHEKCANFAIKKRLVFRTAPYMLECGDDAAIYCQMCGMLCDGFKYTSQGVTPRHCVDVHCSSLPEPFVHNAHSHPLLNRRITNIVCRACKKRLSNDNVLGCYACNFFLCLYCATLPKKILHMSSDDEHPLTLYYGEKSNGTSWCGVCESELDPSYWLYTCSECGVALHVQCAFGDFSRLKPGRIYNFGERDYKVVLNSGNTRPFCSHCHSRCKVPFILRDKSKDNGCICSLSCLSIGLGNIRFLGSGLFGSRSDLGGSESLGS